MKDSAPATVRPPVALGCAAAAGTLVILALIVMAAIAFLESGANTGRMVLEREEAYAPGSVEFIGAKNFHLVRLADGQFLALSDLDAPNRANAQRRCRVAPIPANDPALPNLIGEYRTRMSPPAAGSTLLFREDCNHAIYDVAGLRLDENAANLDRYRVGVDDSGRVTVDLSKRTCSVRSEAQAFAATTCP